MARRYKQGVARIQEALLPPRVEDYVSETNRVRAIDAYVDTLDQSGLGFTNTEGALTPDQPAFAPGMWLKVSLRRSQPGAQQLPAVRARISAQLGTDLAARRMRTVRRESVAHPVVIAGQKPVSITRHVKVDRS